MDTVQHIVHGVLISEIMIKICASINSKVSMILLVILYVVNVIGAFLPDLVGWLEQLYYDDHSRWNWYKNATKRCPSWIY